MWRDLLNRIAASVGGLVLKEEDLEDSLDWLATRLLKQGVPYKAVAILERRLKESLVGLKLKGDWKAELKKRIKQSLLEMFARPRYVFDRPFSLILMVGPNGVGKSTFSAYMAKRTGAVLVEADTFRAGALDQAAELGRRFGVEVFLGRSGESPSSVAIRALKLKKPLIVDTGGRQESDYNLMQELKKIIKVAKPDAVVMAAEATTGGSLWEQLEGYRSVGIDEVVLTKADVGTLGGALTAALAGVPVGYLFYGDRHERFEAQRFVDSLFEEPTKKKFFGLF